MKKILSTFLAFVMTVVLLGGLLGQPVQAAAQKPEFCGTSYTFMFCPEWSTFGLNISNLSEKAKVSVTVSNKSAAKVKWDAERKTAWVTANKICSVKVNFKVTQGGKTYKHTTKMTWLKYNNPLKSLSIGSKNYKVSYFNKNTSAGMKKISGKNQVKVSLKKGYVLRGLGFSRNGVFQDIKNGSKIRFTKKGEHNTVLFIYYTDPKGNAGTLRLFAEDKDTEM